MIDANEIVMAVVVLLVTVGLTTLAAGIRRIPWRFGARAGVGAAFVVTAAWAANDRLLFDPATLVVLGALGGSLAQQAMERGEFERRRISDEITAIREVPRT